MEEYILEVQVGGGGDSTVHCSGFLVHFERGSVVEVGSIAF